MWGPRNNTILDPVQGQKTVPERSSFNLAGCLLAQRKTTKMINNEGNNRC